MDERIADLLTAVRDGNIKRLQATLRAGVNVHDHDPLTYEQVDSQHLRPVGGKPALVIAVERGDLAAAQELLAVGADPNLHAQVSAFYNGQNALHAAAQQGHLELVRLLLASGAKLKAKEIEWSPDNRGKTALELAVENCHRAVVEELVAAFGRELPELKTGTGLHEAAETGQDGVIRLLLSKGVQVDVLAKRSTPLMSAAGHGFPECVKTLLEAGANVNYSTKNGHSPLSAAIYGAYLSPKASNDEKVMEPWVKTLQLLLKHGANVNVITWQKNTPLFMADTYNLPELAKVLRESGGKHADDLHRTNLKD